MDEIDHRIKIIMSTIFEIDINKINDNSSFDLIENWDSMNHMNLIVALEEEFNIQFSDDDIENLLNFKLIKFIIKELIAQ